MDYLAGNVQLVIAIFDYYMYQYLYLIKLLIVLVKLDWGKL